MTDNFNSVYFTERDLGDGIMLSFKWHGGQYIDVQRFGHASEVINVWDSYSDQPTIERTDKAFQAKVDEWIAEYPLEALKHDVLENWS